MSATENNKQIPVIGREYPHPDENDLIAEMIELTNAQMHQMYKKPRALRQVHSKAHGIVRAELTVEKNLPAELRVGLFKEERNYLALIRFSNGVTGVKPDKNPDVRGLAIKLMDVPGEKLLDGSTDSPTHDIVFASSPIFFSKDLKTFMPLLKVTLFGVKGFLLYGIPHAKLLWHALTKVQRKTKHLLDIPYFSGTPYQFGDENQAVKYHLRPSPDNNAIYTDHSDPNYLRTSMQATLDLHEVKFDFCVQFQLDAEKNKIEDASKAWDSPYVKLATLRIPAQHFNNPEQDLFGDNLTYNIWRCLPEHRPLGGFNRARRFIYKALYQTRSDINKMHFEEPTPTPDFLDPINLLK